MASSLPKNFELDQEVKKVSSYFSFKLFLLSFVCTECVNDLSTQSMVQSILKKEEVDDGSTVTLEEFASWYRLHLLI